jgi:hypothetical protein
MDPVEKKYDQVIRSLVNKIPKQWIYGILAAIVVVFSFVGWRFISEFETNVRASAIAECNEVQLEEELKRAKAAAAEAQKQADFWKGKAAEREVKTVEKLVYRDRVTKELIEVQVGLEGEDLIREEISPTTRKFLELTEEQHQ